MNDQITSKRPPVEERLAWIKSHANLDFAGKIILDVGCGDGFFSQCLLKNGAKKVFSLDIVPPELLTKSSNPGLKFIQANLDEKDWSTTLKENNFDIIFAFDVIEHLSSPWNFLNDCKSLLKDNGMMVLTTPNLNSWERFTKPSTWSGATDPQHKTLFSVYSLRFIMERVGLDVLKMSARLRSLGALNKLIKYSGGQIFCLSQKKGK